MSTENKIQTLEELKSLRNTWANNNNKVVFTNGCFDILHLGHVDYLEKSAALGDKLIIGLNTDASVSKLKGPSRPVNNEYARARLLAALSFVDAVVLFGEPTPLNLIETLSPDILVKGDDYAIEDIVGGKHVLENGGEVKTVSLVQGFSTTDIIKKIKSED
ncbi:MAG: D-glycero-beta-D-manno-heptose 1-phosphate adenylyltransferase [Thalassobius sp.]|nr:D-glycero-beta-D-manno-heptose 1-phosphate adenylyltransferase [Thalassovita sp.]